MKYTRIIALLLALALCAGLLTACDPKGGDAESQQSASLPVPDAPDNPAGTVPAAPGETAPADTDAEPASNAGKETQPADESGSPRPIPDGTAPNGAAESSEPRTTEPHVQPTPTQPTPTQPTPTQPAYSASNEDLVPETLHDSSEDLH